MQELLQAIAAERREDVVLLVEAGVPPDTTVSCFCTRRARVVACSNHVKTSFDACGSFTLASRSESRCMKPSPTQRYCASCYATVPPSMPRFGLFSGMSFVCVWCISDASDHYRALDVGQGWNDGPCTCGYTGLPRCLRNTDRVWRISELQGRYRPIISVLSSGRSCLSLLT